MQALESLEIVVKNCEKVKGEKFPHVGGICHSLLEMYLEI